MQTEILDFALFFQYGNQYPETYPDLFCLLIGSPINVLRVVVAVARLPKPLLKPLHQKTVIETTCYSYLPVSAREEDEDGCVVRHRTPAKDVHSIRLLLSVLQPQLCRHFPPNPEALLCRHPHVLSHHAGGRKAAGPLAGGEGTLQRVLGRYVFPPCE